MEDKDLDLIENQGRQYVRVPQIVDKQIRAVDVVGPGLVRVQTGDRPDTMVWTDIRGEDVGVPAVGDYVTVGDGDPRWRTAAEHEAELARRAEAEKAEAERVAGLTVEQRQAEIMALYRGDEPTIVLPPPPPPPSPAVPAAAPPPLAIVSPPPAP